MDNTVTFFGTPVSYHLLEGIEADKQTLFEYAKDLTNFRFIEGGRNWMSLDDNLLVTLGCTTLQQAIQEKIEWYADEVMGIEYDELYATQCWLNQYPPGSSHHMHSHPNCLISSNLWLKTSENCGNLVFEDPYINFRQIEPNIKKETPYNNKTMSIEPIDDHLVIFPSNVHHTVQQNMSSQTRMSLAVNYWIKGTLGVDKYYNKLVL
jgi:uncharacterized protein (TIGR02466 family)